MCFECINDTIDMCKVIKAIFFNFLILWNLISGVSINGEPL